MLNELGQTEQEFLDTYNPSKYERPSVTVDVLIFAIHTVDNPDVRKLDDKKLQVLLVKRGNHPFINNWAIPGGFVGLDEDLEAAAFRELKEETAVDNIYLEQLYTWGDVNRDPRMRIMSTSYMALINKNNCKIKAGFEIMDANWFDIAIKTIEEKETEDKETSIVEKTVEIIVKTEDIVAKAKIKDTIKVVNRFSTSKLEILEQDNISFDHAKILYSGLMRMRNKIEYTDIAFSLLPNQFTLAELQQVYEVILGKTFTKPNFQRKIKEKVIETENFERGAHRPARLYKFNKDWNK
ncbi:MAG TPA: ADP-ribose pyrophosphatase [Clostridiales bacterium]|nr:MAG: ADP-ribose pyrophosphatase [Clostridiales bacterium GWD2_32_19]HCC06918.1 ADP-ribose pyrophosphatase [Clostridiales bacterium]